MPPHLRAVDAALFDLKRAPGLAAELRARIVAASKMDENTAGAAARQAVDFAFVDARMVTSVTQLLAAAHYALTQAALDQMHSHTVHSELIFALNPTSNVGEAMRRFGLSDQSASLLLVHVGPEDFDAGRAISDLLPLESIDALPLDRLGMKADLAAVRKVYKLNGDVALQGLQDREARPMIDSIVSSLVGARATA